MIKLYNATCTGCASCANTCPFDSIKMEYNSEGFAFPVIDANKCKECNLCEIRCPINSLETKYVFLKSYALKLIDKEDIYNSASGGMFYALALDALDKSGVVFGAAYDAEFRVKHIMVDNKEDLQKLRKSKYLQSEIGETYRSVKDQLKEGKPVLFSGSPCEIAGLKAFLADKNYDQLLCVQLFCHATVSPGVWRSYLSQKEKEHNGKTVSVDFRHKINSADKDDNSNIGIAKYGWKNPVFKIVFDNGKEYSAPFAHDAYVNAFTQELTTRQSCYSCKFKLDGTFSGADITIGDFWGAEAIIPEFYVDGGISAVIVYTEKGVKAVEEIENYAELQEVSIEDIRAQNQVVFTPEQAHKNRNAFFKEFGENMDAPEELIKKHLGFFAATQEYELTFGLFGSYNSREIINTACTASNCKLSYQFSNSGIISLMSEKTEIPSGSRMPGNAFRAQMLRGDFEKTFRFYDDSDVDYIIIDLLEERFDIAEYEGKYITLSDAFKDSDISFDGDYRILSNTEKKDIRKSKIDEFVAFLVKKYGLERIILLKTFLSEMYGDGSNLNYFDNGDEIMDFNKTLKELYDYLISNCGIKHVIFQNDQELLYCDESHKHGCYPWHMNRDKYNKYAKQFCSLIYSVTGGAK
jgi:coenzyme F420-reducing hydrogenase beta subunit